MRKPVAIPLDPDLALRQTSLGATPLGPDPYNVIQFDARLFNGYLEPKEKCLTKRPGMATSDTHAGSGVGLGLGNISFTGPITISGDGTLSNGVFTATVDNSNTYWFDLTNLPPSPAAPQYLYFANGTKGYYISSAAPTTVTQIVSANYPAVTVPGSAYLDGTLYVMDSRANIWGSTNLNDPTAWSATNVIQAQAAPGLGVAIARHNSYVVAFKDDSTEFFYDAGAYAGTTTGSVLLPRQDLKVSIGCSSPYSVQSILGSLFFIGGATTTDLHVYSITGAQVQQISTDAVSKFLIASVGIISVIRSWQVAIGGHQFYCLTFTNYTLAYQVDAGMWWLWTENGGPLDVLASVNIAGLGYVRLQSAAQGKYLRTFLTQAYHDTSVDGSAHSVTFDVITPRFDGGTTLKKVLPKLRMFLDNGTGGVVQIRWTDDDYLTWSEWQTCPDSLTVVTFVNGGTFRRRAFQIRCTSLTPFRLYGLEAELLVGSV